MQPLAQQSRAKCQEAFALEPGRLASRHEVFRPRTPSRLRLNVAVRPGPVQAGPRVTEVCLRFGIPRRGPGRIIARNLDLDLSPGTVTLLTGPSGSGKSLLLAAVARQAPDSLDVADVPFPLDVPVLDAVAPTRPVDEVLGILTACGLGEPMLWIRRFQQLSDGERFRARLARAVSLSGRSRGPSVLLCDEFGAILHRRIAKAIAFNLRKLVSRAGLTLILATSQDDLEEDLRPDAIVRLSDEGSLVERPRHGSAEHAAVSFACGLRIEHGSLRDYEQFAAMHYRRRQNIGFVDKVFVLREGRGGAVLGIVVYGRPSLELRLRNAATGGRFVKNATRLNREVRVLKRLIVHPDVRGCGLGHRLVARTLPRVGVRFVECLAAMGAINPVFERAGMRRIGTVAPPSSQSVNLTRLRAAGADPLAADFVDQVRRRPAVRRIVARTVECWHRATRGKRTDIEDQTPTLLAHTYRQLAGSRPVYYLWAADRAGWATIDRYMGGMAGDESNPEAA